MKHFKSNAKLIIISFLMFVGMFLFYREQYMLSRGDIYPLLTFFTYFFTATAHMLIITLIVTLYTKKTIGRFGNTMIVIYGLIVGTIMAINISFNNIISTNILMGIINAIPLAHLLVYIIKYDKKFYHNVFLMQIFGLFIVFVLKTINIIINFDTISLVSNNRNNIGLYVIANILIYSFIISYLLVKNIMVNEELNAHKVVIEGYLHHAIELSEIDPLTGLYNRRKVNETIKSYYEIDYNKKVKFSIIMIDVNDFKRINDTFGHVIGDKVLEYVANVLRQLLREIDIISRWGGDEFLLLLPNTNKESAKVIVDKITHYLEQNKCSDMNEHISLSFGVSDNSECSNKEEMIGIADRNMYLDKKSKSL